MNDLEYYNSFEERLQLELLKLCHEAGLMDQVLAESEDITDKWNDYATPYMADAIEQVNDYPNASIAWPAFMGMAVAAGFAADFSADDIAKEFIAGAKDIFSAALIIGFAAGIIVILENGKVIEPMLTAMANTLQNAGREGAMATMYGIQTFINLFIPSASAKAAITMPIMAPFSDMIGISRQATVLAFQFGDGFTNMITPCSGVLMAVLSVAKIPYEKWVKWAWKFILLMLVVGFLLLLPTLYIDNLPGF